MAGMNQRHDGENGRGRVDVFSGNAFAPPLLSSSSVNKVVVREEGGLPIMFLQRLADDTWAFCSRGDSDWSEATARFGVN